jgi:hypothetical protein
LFWFSGSFRYSADFPVGDRLAIKRFDRSISLFAGVAAAVTLETKAKFIRISWKLFIGLKVQGKVSKEPFSDPCRLGRRSFILAKLLLIHLLDYPTALLLFIPLAPAFSSYCEKCGLTPVIKEG